MAGFCTNLTKKHLCANLLERSPSFLFRSIVLTKDVTKQEFTVVLFVFMVVAAVALVGQLDSGFAQVEHFSHRTVAFFLRLYVNH